MGQDAKPGANKLGVKMSAAPKSRSPNFNTKPSTLKVVGWREWVAFPDFGGPSVRAKVDTGARTSAIHARNIKISKEDGREIADFDIYPHQRDAQTVLHCRAPIIARRRIRNSGGAIQDRVIVRTPIRIGEDVFDIDLSLTRRDRMGYRMLLGRRALKNRYVVDSGRSYVQGPSKSGRKGRPDLRKTIKTSASPKSGDETDAPTKRSPSAVRRAK